MGAEVLAFDRSLIISRHQRVITGWIPIHRVQFACDAPMAVGDVERAIRKVVTNGDGSWPPPVGYWHTTERDLFVLTDGRHEYVARLMRGQRELFVAWVEAES